MAIPIRSNMDFGQNQLLNIVIQVLSSDPGSPVQGQLWFNSTSKTLKMYDGTTTQTLAELTNSLSAFAAPTGTLSMGTNVVSNVSSPSASTDAANKAYVDSAAVGLDVKASVRVASTANLAVASAVVNGVVVDGITLATGDRILLKNQTTASENGVYIVAASGAASRSTDLNSSTNYTPGSFVFVEQGTVGAATGWLTTTQGTYTIGTTSITWTQFSAIASFVAGSGLTLTGNSFSVNVDTTTIAVISSNLSVNASGTQYQVMTSGGTAGVAATWGAVHLAQAAAVTGALPIGNGGTGQTTAAAALTALGGTTKYAVSVGDGSTTSIVVTHNLGTTDVHVQVHSVASTYQVIDVEIQITSTNTITLVFATAPTSNQFRCIVIG